MLTSNYGFKAINNILALCAEFTQDIDDPLGKEWLKTSLCSHIKGCTDYPLSFIKDVVNLLYLSDNL